MIFHFLGTFPRNYSETKTSDGKGVVLMKSSADLWALGCIIYKMATGKTPFGGGSQYLIFKNVEEAKPEIPKDMNPEIVSLLSKLLIKNPKARLGAGENGKIRFLMVRQRE